MVTHEQEYGNMAQRLIHLKDGLVVKNHLNGRYRK
jgi:ABC-type lipoprotein export system ATPase subunit